MANEGNTRVGPRAGGYRTLLAAHLAATALVLLEFALLQALAMGITSAIYALAPVLDSGAPLKFAEWERIFRVISPTITVSGGAGIVLSSIIYARQAQKAQNEAAVAREQATAAREQVNAAREQATAAREQAIVAREQAIAEREQAAAEREQAAAALAQAARLADENASLRLELARATERLAQLENGGAGAGA